MVTVCEWFDLKTTRTVFAGLASKPMTMVSISLASTPVATFSDGLASKYASTVSGGLASKPVTPHVSKPHDYVNHMFMRL
jgi:hypothetical protein